MEKFVTTDIHGEIQERIDVLRERMANWEAVEDALADQLAILELQRILDRTCEVELTASGQGTRP